MFQLPAGIAVAIFISDRRRGIARWIRECQPQTKHFDNSTKQGFENLILAKWKSIMRHVARRHHDHPDPVFPECAHEDDIEPKKWIKIGIFDY